MGIRKKFSYLDYYIAIPFLLLIAVGIVMVYSASSDILSVNKIDPTSYLRRQFFWALAGLFFALLAFLSKLSFWQNRRVVMLGIGVTFALLIFLVFLRIVHPSSAINGAVSWIPLGPINIQPLEIAKITVIIYLAFIFNKRGQNLERGQIFNNLLGPVVLVGLITLLILLQPDTGGASILALIIMIMIFSAGIPIGFGLSFIVAVSGLLPLLINILKRFPIAVLEKNYRYQRILSFLYPFQREQSGGSQLVNSYLAINNGGWFGRGLGNSIQKKGYLPAPYTDFILAIISEELGVIGVLVVLGLLFFLISRIVLIGMRAHTTFRTLVCYGVATMLFVQASFNIAGVIGMLPITGVTLPFISYGGSSMLSACAAIGLVLNISGTEKAEKQFQEMRKVQ